VTPRWELFADILKVGVPGLVNIAITNLSVVESSWELESRRGGPLPGGQTG
jgi:hypothetical protein